MGTASTLRVGDLLERPHFQKARVVAGEHGLGRTIRWVHIIEVTEIGQLVNGNELILSTGLGWHENQALSCSFLRQLIDRGVSGLCVELGTYIRSIPRDMIELAQQHEFPLIVFEEEVRFIDITQDLNGLLMESQYKMMSDLEAFSNQLNHLLLSTDAFQKILRLLHQYLNGQAVYIPSKGEPEFVPSVSKEEQAKLLAQVRSGSHADSFIQQPIRAMGHQFADLVVFAQHETWSDFDSLVLDRTATALGQEQMRVLYIEEKRKSAENRWVEKWVNGEPDKKEIEQHLSAIEPSLKPNGCVVCLGKSDFLDRDVTYHSMMLRSIFEQQGFFLLVSFDRNQVTLVLVNKRKKEDWRHRIRMALGEIRNKDFIKEQSTEPVHFGIGKLIDHLDGLHESYRMAEEVLSIQQTIGKTESPFYEEQSIYRLISRLDRQRDLQPFVQDHIGPVLAFDQKHNSHMLETLKVFLEVNGSKKEAAERLYIVRQTLYHRIEKLKELLGDDFMHSEKRLAIEMAVYALAFVEG